VTAIYIDIVYMLLCTKTHGSHGCWKQYYINVLLM